MPRKQKGELVRRFGNCCHYCGETTNRTPGHALQATIEHVVPRAFGGRNNIDNYVLACAACNNERGSQLFFCQCEWYCGPLIQEALASDEFIQGMFDGMIAHNTPRVYKHGDKWAVRLYHGRKHYPTWEAAMNAALNWKD